MPVIITEIAIQADGTFAVELHNNGASAVDISNRSMFLQDTGAGGISFNFPASTIIPAGGTVTVGHSSIAGLDFTDDFRFDTSNFIINALGSVAFSEFGPGNVATDSIGIFPGPDLGTDIVYQGATNRTPDADVATGSNIGDFTATPGFSNNSLGIPCFLTGTMIATPDGERAVQDLQAGDLVLTADGRSVPVLWLGEQLVKKRIGQIPEALEPGCIKAGTLGTHSDLYVTADHGMIIDDLIVNAGALVNGDTITWVEYRSAYTVYHIETEAHEVLIANGAKTESFLDVTTRKMFDNARTDNLRIIPEMRASRITSARLLPDALKARLGLSLQPQAMPSVAATF